MPEHIKNIIVNQKVKKVSLGNSTRENVKTHILEKT